MPTSARFFDFHTPRRVRQSLPLGEGGAKRRMRVSPAPAARVGHRMKSAFLSCLRRGTFAIRRKYPKAYQRKPMVSSELFPFRLRPAASCRGGSSARLRRSLALSIPRRLSYAHITSKKHPGRGAFWNSCCEQEKQTDKKAVRQGTFTRRRT